MQVSIPTQRRKGSFMLMHKQHLQVRPTYQSMTGIKAQVGIEQQQQVGGVQQIAQQVVQPIIGFQQVAQPMPRFQQVAISGFQPIAPPMSGFPQFDQLNQQQFAYRQSYQGQPQIIYQQQSSQEHQPNVVFHVTEFSFPQSMQQESFSMPDLFRHW